MKKIKKLTKLLEKLTFNQVVIFTKSISCCTGLCKFLNEEGFPAFKIHRGILQCYKQFKESKTRVLVATYSHGDDMDNERVNILFNYDVPESADFYLHRATYAGRLGRKGLAITFVANEDDRAILNEIENHFLIQINEMPDEIDATTYIEDY